MRQSLNMQALNMEIKGVVEKEEFEKILKKFIFF